MRVDFYQLGTAPLEPVAAALAEKLLGQGERLLIVADDEALRARLDRVLWDHGPDSFLPHAVAGGGDDRRQPVLLAASPDAVNRARNLLIADGRWREAALGFERTFYLFGPDSLEQARSAWRSLAKSPEAERQYWAHEDGRWACKASDSGKTS